MNNRKSPKFVFDKIANDLRKGRYDEFFTDPRGGFFRVSFGVRLLSKKVNGQNIKPKSKSIVSGAEKF